MQTSVNNAILILEDGTHFFGRSFGIAGTSTGEICFNTGMTGYQEIFTDPSYYGQIMVATTAHIGNYGAVDTEVESDNIQISALVCKNITTHFSRQMADSDIKEFFAQYNVPVISHLDTRAIVRHIRNKGAMNALVACETDLNTDKLLKILNKAPSMDGLELASKVTTRESYEMGTDDADLRIAVMDFGTKKNILQCFVDRGCKVKVFPAKTSFAEVSSWQPDGYFLSNGPGDPASMDYAVEFTKQVLAVKKPVFGICLGHQILALALGIPTYKMHHGHRGINHPVLNVLTGRCEITSQNHGFGVSPDKIAEHSEIIEVSHKNLNDQTIEGIRHRYLPAFSVQYHPESSPGPHDSRYLFDDFITLIKKQKTLK